MLFMLYSCASEEAQKAAEKPNVLFIIADDFGYHDMSSRGSDYYETPNLDRLAARNMIFANGYAAFSAFVKPYKIRKKGLKGFLS